MIESPYRLKSLLKLKMDTCCLFDDCKKAPPFMNDTTIIVKHFANTTLGPSQAGHLPNFLQITYD